MELKQMMNGSLDQVILRARNASDPEGSGTLELFPRFWRLRGEECAVRQGFLEGAGSGRPGGYGGSERSERSGKSGGYGESVRSGGSARSGRSGGSERSGGYGGSERSEGSERSARSGGIEDGTGRPVGGHANSGWDQARSLRSSGMPSIEKTSEMQGEEKERGIKSVDTDTDRKTQGVEKKWIPTTTTATTTTTKLAGAIQWE
eukprot:gene12050-15155_t